VLQPAPVHNVATTTVVVVEPRDSSSPRGGFPASAAATSKLRISYVGTPGGAEVSIDAAKSHKSQASCQLGGLRPGSGGEVLVSVWCGLMLLRSMRDQDPRKGNDGKRLLTYGGLAIARVSSPCLCRNTTLPKCGRAAGTWKQRRWRTERPMPSRDHLPATCGEITQ